MGSNNIQGFDAHCLLNNQIVYSKSIDARRGMQLYFHDVRSMLTGLLRILVRGQEKFRRDRKKYTRRISVTCYIH